MRNKRHPAPKAALLLAGLWGCAEVPEAVGPARDAAEARPSMGSGSVWVWTEPKPLETLNTQYPERYAVESKDGLSLYFMVQRPGADGKTLKLPDIWVSRRASRISDWGPPMNLDSINTETYIENAPTFSTDGHRMYFHSNRPPNCSGSPNPGRNSNDLWVAERANVNDDFTWTNVRNLDARPDGTLATLPDGTLDCRVSSAGNEIDPTYTRENGDEVLYFSRGILTEGTLDIYTARRAAGEARFEKVEAVSELNTFQRNDMRVAISHDGRELYLSSSRGGKDSQGLSDLWVYTRQSHREPWQDPQNLRLPVNTKDFEVGPSLSFDGSRLYFYWSPAGTTSADLRVSTRTRRP